MALLDALTRTRANPVFYADTLRAWLSDEPGRAESIMNDPDSVDLLTWNVFASLDTHDDPDWYAHRMRMVVGNDARAPIKVSHFSGARRGPRLTPNREWIDAARARARSVRSGAASFGTGGATGGGAGTDDADAAVREATRHLDRPVEVPLRVDAPGVLALVETMTGTYPIGHAGRDRLVELVDAGLDAAHRLSRRLTVTVVYEAGTAGARQASARLAELRDPARLAAELPHRRRVPDVTLLEVAWQQVLRVWDTEADARTGPFRPVLRLGGEPVRAFRKHVRARGLL